MQWMERYRVFLGYICCPVFRDELKETSLSGTWRKTRKHRGLSLYFFDCLCVLCSAYSGKGKRLRTDLFQRLESQGSHSFLLLFLCIIMNWGGNREWQWDVYKFSTPHLGSTNIRTVVFILIQYLFHPHSDENKQVDLVIRVSLYSVYTFYFLKFTLFLKFSRFFNIFFW